MTRTSPILAVVGMMMSVALLVGAPTSASAGACGGACFGAKKVCVDAALQARRACKADCQAASTPLGCFQACRADFALAKVTCKTALTDCHTSCVDEHPCAGECAAQGWTCAQAVRDRAATCGNGCLASARASGEACHRAPFPPFCLLGVARDLGRCLHGCAATAHAGGEACGHGMRCCLAQCGGGSAGGAFGCSSPGAAFLDLR
ncbi:MAG: hypothetical protein U0807_16270 [Candidatus Binatia bacterium]